jgi:hypothetical protein
MTFSRRRFLHLAAGSAAVPALPHIARASLLPGSPADFGKLVADETEKWGKVIRFAGIEAE